MTLRRLFLAASLALCPALLGAQDARARLEARGLPADLVTQVVQIAADATAQGLAADPLVDKAIEGFAKHVPSPRITAALQQFSARMVGGRAAVREAGIAAPSGELVTAAAEALGRGIAPAQVGSVVHAAREPALAAPALTVAAALTAQGMGTDQAVAVVSDAMRQGRTAAQILDLPSLARSMQASGTPDEAGRRMMRGEGPPGGPRPGDGPDGRGIGGPGPDGRKGMPGGPPPPPRPPDGGRHGGSGGSSGPGGGGQPGHP